MPIFNYNIEHENLSQLLHSKRDTDVVDLKEQDKRIFEFILIGKTVRERRINVILIGERKADPKLRIFIMAGQHGDESYSRRAAERLISYLIKTKAKEFSDIGIAILPNANPDGAYKNNRRTSSGIDMNRDHLLLVSEENQAIHSFVRSWKPNLIVDLHNYTPKRKYLAEKNYVFYHDVLIDTPTNLAIQKRPDQDKLKSLIQNIQSDLKQFNYSCERYVLIDEKGKVRHSTHDIIDARNFLSLRYNTFSILVEAREPLPDEERKKETKHIISAQYEALLSILKWATKNIDFLLEKSNEPSFKKRDRIAIRSSYIKSEQPFRMNFKNTITKKIDKLVFLNYESGSRPTRFVKMPYAYAVPEDKNGTIHVLHSHGFISEHTLDSKSYRVQRHFILSCSSRKTDKTPRPPANVRLIFTDETIILSKYVVFLTNQEGGYCLPLLLEPQSSYGLSRYEQLGLNIIPGNYYPIIRVMEGHSIHLGQEVSS
jgi:hypothetical protein